jgi:hypothetical protein
LIVKELSERFAATCKSHSTPSRVTRKSSGWCQWEWSSAYPLQTAVRLLPAPFLSLQILAELGRLAFVRNLNFVHHGIRLTWPKGHNIALVSILKVKSSERLKMRVAR